MWNAESLILRTFQNLFILWKQSRPLRYYSEMTYWLYWITHPCLLNFDINPLWYMLAYFILFVTEVFLALWMTQQWLINHFQCILNKYFPQAWAIYVRSSHACAWKFLFYHVPMVLSSTHPWPITRIVMLSSPKLAAFSPAANSGFQIWCCVSNWTYGNGISLAPFAHLRAFSSGPWAPPFQGFCLMGTRKLAVSNQTFLF